MRIVVCSSDVCSSCLSPIHYFLLWPNAMTYWFYVNDRRLVVVAKIGVYYMSLYAGFFLPYALPDEYSYPYFVSATINRSEERRVWNECVSTCSSRGSPY